MRFINKQDAQQFLVEINRFDLVQLADKDFVPTKDMEEEFIRGRDSIVPKLKSFRKSQAGKESWRKHRHKYMSGIHGFHKSTDGKKFHRALGRYLSTRITNRDSGGGASSHEEKFEALKSISSLRTHLYIDKMYFRPLNDQVDFDLFLDEAVIATINEEKRLYTGEQEFNDRDIDILCRSVNPKDLVESFCETKNLNFIQGYLDNFSNLELVEDKDYITVLCECIY